MALVRRAGRDTGLDPQDFSARQRQADILGPALGQKRPEVEPQSRVMRKRGMGHGQAFICRAYAVDMS